jgi:hypothetical protein
MATGFTLDNGRSLLSDCQTSCSSGLLHGGPFAFYVWPFAREVLCFFKTKLKYDSSPRLGNPGDKN